MEISLNMINDLDRKLIISLQKNGRASHVELCRDLGVHVSTIAKKMQTLEESGLIKIRALPNPAKMGYLAHAVIAIKADNNKIGNVCSHLYSNFNVNLIVTTFGRFEILMIVYFPNWNQLLDYVLSELSKIEGILNFEIYFVKQIQKRSYLPIVDNITPVKIDDIDRKIIAKLTEDGRCTSHHLAGEIGVSSPTCTRRLAFLLNEKVIEIKAVPYMSKIENVANAFTFLRVRPNKLEGICKKLVSYKGIFLMMTLFNSYDILIGLNASSQEELHRLINSEIIAMDGIVAYETIIRAEIKKRYYGGSLVNNSNTLI